MKQYENQESQQLQRSAYDQLNFPKRPRLLAKPHKRCATYRYDKARKKELLESSFESLRK